MSHDKSPMQIAKTALLISIQSVIDELGNNWHVQVGQK